MMNEAGVPRLLGVNIPGVRLVWVDLDELHIYIDVPVLSREDAAFLVAAVAGAGASDAIWEIDHIRLWWD